jgi:hypothetical protein
MICYKSKGLILAPQKSSFVAKLAPLSGALCKDLEAVLEQCGDSRGLVSLLLFVFLHLTV